MKKVLCILVFTLGTTNGIFAQTTSENYIKTTTYQIETQDGNVAEDSRIESIDYVDGLGRPIQSINVRAGGNKENVVSYMEYNEVGRETRQYLPWASSSQVSSGSSLNFIPPSNLLSRINEFYDIGAYDDTDNPYSEVRLETSPLKRVLEIGAPGNDWDINSQTPHTIRNEYDLNAENEVMRFKVHFNENNPENPYLIKVDYFASGELYKNIAKDENWLASDGIYGQTIEYTNKLGQVILKRVSVFDESLPPNSPNYHDTYYIYDVFGNLTFVLSPEGSKAIMASSTNPVDSDILDNYCYRYAYDKRNRVIKKKIPGKGWEYIVYDKLDRPVLTQDQNLKSKSEWLFTKYDKFGRIAYTGIYTASTNSREYLQFLVNSYDDNFTERSNTPINFGNSAIFYTTSGFPASSSSIPLNVLTVNYYDDYVDYSGTSKPDIVLNQYTTEHSSVVTTTKGLPTVSKVRVLGTDAWITTLTAYDKKGQPIYVYSKNDYLETRDIGRSLLDFTGKPIESHTTHIKTGNTPINIRDYFTYDHMGRLNSHKQKIANEPVQLIAENNYDELGQLVGKNVGGQTAQDGYTDIVNMTVSNDGNIVHDPPSDDAWNFPSRLKTKGVIESDINGGIRGTATSLGKHVKIGLVKTTNNGAAKDYFDYGFYTDATNQDNELRVIVNNAYVDDINTTYAVGDILKVTRVGTDIIFSKNTHILYTHNNADVNESLIGKVSMSGPGASINEVSLHGDVINKILQNIDYTYNIRGWLTDINKVKTTVASTKYLFNFKINYNTTNAGATPLYNGNISETFWNTKNDDDDVRGYKYTYDQLNRIKIAKFTKGTGINNQEEGFFYDVENITYDTNGNIQSLTRSGSTDEESIAIWDDLTYTYSGNKLLKVDDAYTISYGFIDGNPNSTGIVDYRYDANGNMTVDKNKNIKRIFYNHLNLPTRIEFENQDAPGNLSNYIEYTYDATGLKMKKEVMPDGAPPQITEYAGSYIYSDSDSVNNLHLQFISHPEGYIIPTVIGGTRTSKSVKGFKKDTGETTYSDYAYVFQYKDHLGNVRLSYSDADLNGAIDPANEIIEESNYYPFGLEHKGYNNVVSSNANSVASRFKFGGKELSEELGLDTYDFGARNYMPDLGRWSNIDPLAEKFSHQSPYAYANNNPIIFVDPDGRAAIPFDEFDQKGNKISSLGGSETDFYHQKDGSTKVVDRKSGKSNTIKGGESIIRGYTERNGKTNYNDIFKEFKEGTGPEKSVMYGKDHQMNEGIIDSYQFYRASEKMIDSGESKMKVKGTFGVFGAIRSGANMQEQMMGKANISMYELGDKILFLVLDSKSKTSWSLNPFAKGEDNNISRDPNKTTPEGNTFQTYIFSLTKKETKDAIETYDIENGEF
ncbi:RHS repeat-associated core domain-containing protein [Flavobacteriaceae bacterium]|nr:RHS repeat-associated core domain-containing protein [Flavobacteriaceae bacterium]